MFNEMSLIIRVRNGYYKHDRGGVVRYMHVPTKKKAVSTFLGNSVNKLFTGG